MFHILLFKTQKSELAQYDELDFGRKRLEVWLWMRQNINNKIYTIYLFTRRNFDNMKYKQRYFPWMFKTSACILRSNFSHIQIYNYKILQSSQKSTMIRLLII